MNSIVAELTLDCSGKGILKVGGTIGVTVSKDENGISTLEVPTSIIQSLRANVRASN